MSHLSNETVSIKLHQTAEPDWVERAEIKDVSAAPSASSMDQSTT
jgi:hypothetical protein